MQDILNPSAIMKSLYLTGEIADFNHVTAVPMLQQQIGKYSLEIIDKAFKNLEASGELNRLKFTCVKKNGLSQDARKAHQIIRELVSNGMWIDKQFKKDLGDIHWKLTKGSALFTNSAIQIAMHDVHSPVFTNSAQEEIKQAISAIKTLWMGGWSKDYGDVTNELVNIQNLFSDEIMKSAFAEFEKDPAFQEFRSLHVVSNSISNDAQLATKVIRLILKEGLFLNGKLTKEYGDITWALKDYYKAFSLEAITKAIQRYEMDVELKEAQDNSDFKKLFQYKNFASILKSIEDENIPLCKKLIDELTVGQDKVNVLFELCHGLPTSYAKFIGEKVYPKIKDYITFANKGLILSPNGMEYILNLHKQKGKMQNLSYKICTSMPEFVHTMQNIFDQPGPFITNVVTKHFAEGHTKFNNYHVTPLFIKKDANNQIKIAITDTGGTESGFPKAVIDYLKSNIDCSKYNLEFYYMKDRRQFDIVNCPVFAIKDMHIVDSSPESYLSYFFDNSASLEQGLSSIDRIPVKMIKSTQSLNRVNQFLASSHPWENQLYKQQHPQGLDIKDAIYRKVSESKDKHGKVVKQNSMIKHSAEKYIKQCLREALKS